MTVDIQQFSFVYKNKRKDFALLFSDKIKTKLLGSKLSNRYRLCLIRIGRRKNPFFKVVVTNYNRKKIDIIGVFLPRANLYKKEKVFYNNSFFFQRKQLNVDFEKLFFWLRKRIIPSTFVYHLIKSIGQSFFFLTSQNNTVQLPYPKFNSVLKNNFIQEYSNEG